jgi:hypothetical protein
VARLTNTHEDTPEDNESDDRNTGTATNERLSESCNNDQNQLETVHLLATDDISEGTEADLTNNGTGGCRELDGGILRSEENTLIVLLVDNTKHDRQEGDTEDVVAVCEETSTSDENGANMVPAERRLVDFSERETTTLVRLRLLAWNTTL